MLKNYFRTAWRNFRRSRLHALINIAGLAVGLASFIVILLYLNYELSYDKWDASLKRVYKVSVKQQGEFLSTTPAPLASLLAQNYPEVNAATAIIPFGDYEVLLDAGGKKIYQKGLVETDSSFFKVFPYTLAQGDAATALNQPDAIILSEEVSRKLFGTANPMGRPVKLYNAVNGVVTGVLREPQGPSHLTVKILMRDPFEKSNRFWQNFSFNTYIRLRQPVATAKLQGDLNRVYNSARHDSTTALFTDAVGDIHNFPQHGESHFTITIVLLVLAVFILIAGAINFSNLSLARAMTRAKEVGIRKVLGSSRIHIVFQSLLEITLQCLISLGLALLLVNRALPFFSSQFNFSGGWNAEVNGFYNAKSYDNGAVLSYGRGMFALGGGKKILKDKATIKLNLRDPLYLMNYHTDSELNKSRTQAKYVWDNRRIIMTLVYRFGRSGNSGPEHKNSAGDEQRRVKSGGGNT